MHKRNFRNGAARPFEPRDRLVRARLQQMRVKTSPSEGDRTLICDQLFLGCFSNSGFTRAFEDERTALGWNVFGRPDFAKAVGIGLMTAPGPLQVIVPSIPNEAAGVYPGIEVRSR